MAYGLRVRDASGVLTLDLGDRITRYISRHGFALDNGVQGTVTIPGWTEDSTWAYYCTNLTYRVERSGGVFTLTGKQNGSYGELLIFRY